MYNPHKERKVAKALWQKLYECPTCKRLTLTAEEHKRRYQCSACTRAAEFGLDANYSM